MGDEEKGAGELGISGRLEEIGNGLDGDVWCRPGRDCTLEVGPGPGPRIDGERSGKRACVEGLMNLSEIDGFA